MALLTPFSVRLRFQPKDPGPLAEKWSVFNDEIEHQKQLTANTAKGPKKRLYRKGFDPIWALEISYKIFLFKSWVFSFITEADRILSPDFHPTMQDVLRTRIPTIGIHEIEFPYKDKILRMTDLGGQRTERRKWIHCFDNVSAILFIIDISSYNMK